MNVLREHAADDRADWGELVRGSCCQVPGYMSNSMSLGKDVVASTHWMFSRGTLGKACLLTSAFARTAFAASSRAGVAPASSGRVP